MTDWLALACTRLGTTKDKIMSHRITATEIVLVVWPGPKYTIPLAELEPKPTSEPLPVKAPHAGRGRA
jgi:hypothetical protein